MVKPKYFPKQSVSRLADKRASVLILALWSLLFLTALAVIVNSVVRQKLEMVGRLDNRSKLNLIAEAGINKAILQLAKEDFTGFTAFRNLCLDTPAASKDIPIGDGKVDICYPVTDPLGREVLRYGVVDEARKININKANMATLKRLFVAATGCDIMQAQELAACVIDWRDKDSFYSLPSGSAENPEYLGLARPYRAKDNAFEVLDELLLVQGITPDVFAKLKDYVTIYGDSDMNLVNINTAPKPVLLSLGLSEELVEKILAFRNGPDGLEGTVDDNIFIDLEEMTNTLMRYTPLTKGEIIELRNAQGLYFTLTSGYFMVRAEARLPTSKEKSETVAIINSGGEILYWQES